MSDDRSDARPPLGNMRFRVEIDGAPESGAVEVVFPEARIASVPPKPAAVRSPRSRRAPRAALPVTYGSLTLRRGLTRSGDWYAWWDEARRGLARARRAVRVTLCDARGEPANAWLFRDAVPLAYRLSPLDARGNDVVYETLELAVGGFDAEHAR